jgi:RNA polymerase sigma-70 factor (sigma-E family)
MTAANGNESGILRRHISVRLTSNPSADDPMAVDPEDFQSFVVSRGAHLYRTACLLTGGDTHLAEDLVQEALSRMFPRWGRRWNIDNPSAYAQTVLVNVFLSQRRKKSSSELPTAQVADSAATGDNAALRMTLLDALAGLSELDRAVLVLRYWEDRSVEETAAALDLKAGTVRARSSRALVRVREILGADFAEFAES